MKRIELINTLGTRMWVTEDRVKEYLAAGHKLAAELKAETPTEDKPKRKRTAKK